MGQEQVLYDLTHYRTKYVTHTHTHTHTYTYTNTHTHTKHLRTLPTIGFRGGLWVIVNRLVKTVELPPPVTAYMELEEVSAILVLKFLHAIVGFSYVLMQKFNTCASV